MKVRSENAVSVTDIKCFVAAGGCIQVEITWPYRGLIDWYEDASWFREAIVLVLLGMIALFKS